MKPLRILSLPVDDGGCGFYRVRQPLEMIRRFTPHDAYIIDSQKDDMLQVAKAMELADLLLVRQGGEGGLMDHVLTQPEYRDKRWVLDIDDNIELISPYSWHYQEYGTEEFFDRNAQQWLWKDGVQGFNLKLNRFKVASLIKGLRQAFLVTVTTEKLAEYARQYNPRVAVLPNCINFERWWKLPLTPNKKLRVGWSGGISHYEDWYQVKEPLNALLRKYQFQLVIAGSQFKGVIDPDNRQLVETHDWVPFKGHSYRMMCLNLDIALIPLADTDFNHYKSSIKWYEMSAMAVPSLVANTLPYSAEIKDGQTAVGYTDAKGFYQGLERLILDADLRQTIGNNAYQWVRKHRSAKENVQLWINAYQSLIDSTG